MGRRRRRTRKKPPGPHPPLWPYLLGLAIVLSLGLLISIRHLEREHPRSRSRRGGAERAGAAHHRAASQAGGRQRGGRGRRGLARAPAAGADDGHGGQHRLIPVALSHGTGAEVQRPLAAVVIGGLVTSTLLTLLVLPTLYAWIKGLRERRERNAPAVERASRSREDT